MTDRFCGVPFAAKVDAFEAEIRRHQCFVSGWNADNGTVFPDAGD